MAELYSLPDGWEWKKLGDLAKFQSGGTPSRSNKTYWDNGNIPWVKISDITDEMYVTNTEEFITKAGLDNSSAKLFPKNTILYTIFATIGKIGILDIEATTNQAISGIQPKNNVDLFYMYYGLKFITNEVQKVSTGVAQNNINLTKLKEQWFPLPPLEEQKRIVVNLDNLFAKIDKVIALHQKNIDEADIFMASVLNYVFVELEEKYGLIKINDVVVKTKNKNPLNEKDTPFTYIDISSIDNKLFKIVEPKQLIGSEAPSRAKKEVFQGDIIYSTTRPNLKNIAIVSENYNNSIASTGFCVLRTNEKTINYYLFYFLITEKLFEQIEPNIRGAQYPATSDNDLKNCNIPNTPYETQQKVVSYLDEISNKMEKIKNLQKKKMQSLKELKASILDKAFKGEL